MDIGHFLRKLGLERYEAAFRENKVDSEILPKLTAEDLKDLGIALVGDRRRLLDAIASLHAGTQTPTTETPHIAEPRIGRGSPIAEAERRQLTVMFVDLVGSTELSRRLDPEVMREVIRTYQNAVTSEIGRFDGHVAKFMGDGVLAFFGWPHGHEDDAERAGGKLEIEKALPVGAAPVKVIEDAVGTSEEVRGVAPPIAKSLG